MDNGGYRYFGGVGFYSAVFVGTVFALVVVLVFRWIETRIPTLAYARLTLRFRRDMTMPETELSHSLRVKASVLLT